MTVVDWRDAARKIWEAAFAVDPVHTMEVTVLVTGREVFAWDLIPIVQVRALHRGLFSTARLSC